MRRCFVALLALSVFAFGTRASALHVHAYFDHDHQHHDHGPALHEHKEEHEDEALHVEPCDPSAHVVRLSYTASVGSEFQPDLADEAVVAPGVPPPSLIRVVCPLDTRGHGPPPSPSRQLRAPPIQPFR